MKKIIFVLLIIVLVAGCLEQRKETPYSKFYAGDYRNFRGNLFEAENIAVYPNEDSVRNVLLNPDIVSVYVAFVPNETENSLYLASAFEMVNKLSIIYIHLFQGSRNVDSYKAVDGSTCLAFYSRDTAGSLTEKCFKSLPLNTTAEAFQIAKETEPVILLLGPSQTNITAVSVRDFVITAEGSNFSEVNRTYTDLDLSVDKIILILMGSEGK